MPASLYEHRSPDQVGHPATRWTTQTWNSPLPSGNGPVLRTRGPCSRAPFTRVTTARTSPRDWAVPTGSHVRQDMVICSAPPHLGATSSPDCSHTPTQRSRDSLSHRARNPSPTTAELQTASLAACMYIGQRIGVRCEGRSQAATAETRQEHEH